MFSRGRASWIGSWPRCKCRRSRPGRGRFAGRCAAGCGLFALRDLDAGAHIIEYRGQIITWRTALLRHAKTGTDGHTYYFDRGDGTVIDGAVGGNCARFLNHSCEPNCEAVIDDGRIHIYTTRPVTAGSELLLDYASCRGLGQGAGFQRPPDRMRRFLALAGAELPLRRQRRRSTSAQNRANRLSVIGVERGGRDTSPVGDLMAVAACPPPGPRRDPCRWAHVEQNDKPAPRFTPGRRAIHNSADPCRSSKLPRPHQN
jgi:hypothetical protein